MAQLQIMVIAQATLGAGRGPNRMMSPEGPVRSSPSVPATSVRFWPHPPTPLKSKNFTARKGAALSPVTKPPAPLDRKWVSRPCSQAPTPAPDFGLKTRAAVPIVLVYGLGPRHRSASPVPTACQQHDSCALPFSAAKARGARPRCPRRRPVGASRSGRRKPGGAVGGPEAQRQEVRQLFR